ncbi:putative metal-dependent HD superfamily phosphohydrolase [Arthrobacter sp. CAN_A214]|uniref:DUF4031 domain-containing protein n=1 Tax=Arthrobacter sp. CAN_A214 TaxID=2787720 RepID=UPI0018C987C8
MAVFIDPPRWPAHGTVFSHLVSDSSLEELHSFASAAGIGPRAFDLDHYDVPARRYRDLVRRGAKEVEGGDLVRLLVASGLRVPARRRPGRLRRTLLLRWNEAFTDLPGAGQVGEELLGRWGEPHRKYHTYAHLLAVLEALDTLFDDDDDAAIRRSVQLAAWFHDAVYQGVAGDERNSAALAGELLGGLPADDTAEVQRLVLLTISHSPSTDDRAGALLCDADLAVLGGLPADYARYVAAVREEYASVPDADFITGRAGVVRRLLGVDPLYRTQRAQRLWLDAARANLANELAGLEGPRTERRP